MTDPLVSNLTFLTPYVLSLLFFISFFILNYALFFFLGVGRFMPLVIITTENTKYTIVEMMMPVYIHIKF